MRRFGCFLAAIFCLVVVHAGARAGESLASSYPSKPIRIIVPYAAGGGMDIATRLLARYAEMELGQNIVVENITKGGNVAGYLEGIGASPDGYTLLAWGINLVTDELIVKSAPYTYKDVLPLCLFADDPEAIVVEAEFARENDIATLEDLFAYVRANSGTVTIGMGGNWTAHDFLRLKMEAQTDVKFNRMPFLGGKPALQAAATGNCNVALPFISELLGLENADGVVPLAVAYDERVPQLPDVPSVGEAGYPGMTQSIWRVLSLPNGTPDGVVSVLENAFRKAIANPGLREEARALGINPVFRSSVGLGTFLEREHAFYLVKAREWGILVDRGE
jgi:Uncharacterized protein conserved in bacteria